MNTTILDFLSYDTQYSIVTVDASIYNPDVPITQPTIDITPPNFSCGSPFNYIPNGTFNTNSYILGWSQQNCPTELTDGLWVFKISICPNDQLVKEKNYLRIYSTKNSILSRIVSLKENHDEKEATKLLYVLQDLEVSKYMVEHLCEVEKGIILFNAICEQVKRGCTYC